jgi:16S rRNA (cytosine1402-N4)-methyltransferase
MVPFAHDTVLLGEAVDQLVLDPSGTYVDATFGRGGHAGAILSRLNQKGRLLGMDKDWDAIRTASVLAEADNRFIARQGSFADIRSTLLEAGLDKVQGILADLGVSSPQLDDASRGFSFMKDGPLDMRMDTSSGISAAQWLAAVSEQELTEVLRIYGEERHARRIATAIVGACRAGVIDTTARLARVVSDANPSWEKHKHPATRSFQAIRIKINNELGDLERFLADAAQVLLPGGRLVVISFHSLEDRMVKQFMRTLAKGDAPPKGVPVREQEIVRSFRLVGKAIQPTDQEIARNPRARSAVMRVLERINHD